MKNESYLVSSTNTSAIWLIQLSALTVTALRRIRNKTLLENYELLNKNFLRKFPNISFFFLIFREQLRSLLSLHIGLTLSTWDTMLYIGRCQFSDFYNFIRKRFQCKTCDTPIIHIFSSLSIYFIQKFTRKQFFWKDFCNYA